MSEQMAPARRTAGSITGAGTFTVQSATDPEQSWVVEWINARNQWCGCPCFAKANRCRHVRAVFAAIEAEWATRRENEARERATGKAVHV